MILKDEIISCFGLPENVAEDLERTALNFQALGMGNADYFMLGLRRAFEGGGYTLSELMKICHFDYQFKARKVKRLSSARRINHVGETFPGRSICKKSLKQN